MPDKTLTPREIARNKEYVSFVPDWLRFTGVTQRALAERLNLSESQISKWLSGKQAMSTAQFQMIAEAIGIGWEELHVAPQQRKRGKLYREVAEIVGTLTEPDLEALAVTARALARKNGP